MSSTITIDNCDSEPIAFPSAIQSHGMLIVLDRELKIRQISENCVQFLGFEPGDVLNTNISEFLDEEQFDALKVYLAFENLKALVPLPVKFCLPDGVCSIFHCAAQRYPSFVIVELEPILGPPQELSLPSSLSIAIENLQSKSTSKTALQNAAECVKDMTGYDRVLIYKFDADWHGEVVAEAAENVAESYLGLHFPASDIPSQARELYRRNLLRMIVEVDYAAVKITPEINPVTNELLDMSDCVLRSVSPIHVEYLSNMGVKATLTISLIVNGQLWGLIACHHYSSKFLSGWLRTACDMFGRMTSMHLKGLIDAEVIQAEKNSSELLDEFITVGLRQNADLGKTFDIYADKLQNIFNASGIALVEDEVVTAKGLVPNHAIINKLTSYIFGKEETIFSSDNLQEIFGDNAPKEFAGILSIRTSYLRNEWLIFFREEQLKFVNWAGNPNKLIQSSEGILNLHPRASFALWTEEVEGRSLPWTSNDFTAAKLLRERMLDLRQEFLDRERLREQDLHAQREEFFAVLTHDLKNPILGTLKILEFMKTGKLKPQGEQYEAVLDQLIKAQNQVYERIKSFLLSQKYSAADSTFSYEPLNVKGVVDRAINMVNLFASTEDIFIESSIDGDLRIIGESDEICRVIENLLSNAIKFSATGSTINLSASKVTNEVIISIQDRGPGIPESEIPLLFKRFWQGQSGKRTASSTGLGLYTCRQIVEAHNGRIWCENVPEIGAKFSVRLPAI